MSREIALVEKFSGKYEVVPWTGCWIWTGVLRWTGYARFKIKEVQHEGHRISWQLHRGEIPAGLHVLHRCDVPCCVNPDHLFLGTSAENHLDCVEKKRNRRGESPIKLTADAVRDIRSKRLTRKGFSDLYGVDRPHITAIQKRRAWQSVP